MKKGIFSTSRPSSIASAAAAARRADVPVPVVQVALQREAGLLVQLPRPRDLPARVVRRTGDRSRGALFQPLDALFPLLAAEGAHEAVLDARLIVPEHHACVPDAV